MEGTPFAKQIAEKPSYTVLFSVLAQCLWAVHVAQQEVKFTHRDLHCNNVMLREDKYRWHYYEGYSPPMLLFTAGKRAVIIDFEFAHTSSPSSQSTSFDSRIDLLSLGYIPFRFDPSYDVCRLLLTSFSEFKRALPDEKAWSKTKVAIVQEKATTQLREMIESDGIQLDGPGFYLPFMVNATTPNTPKQRVEHSVRARFFYSKAWLTKTRNRYTYPE